MKPAVDAAFFEQETHLNDKIQFNLPLSQYAHQPRSIFLTGATGLLGSFLLEDLLQKTTADIYCLVRAENMELGKQRLIRHLDSYQLWQADFYDRVIPVIGDLALPLFGLTEHHFNQLAATIDVIYHSAGWINLLFPYSKLKPINVTGVEQALRLASLVHTKPFHFVSSIAVFYSDAHPGTQTLYEDNVPLFHSSIKADYGKSKWVADKLVANAQARGLPTTIYRPIRIMGSSVTGALNDNSELLPRLLKGCIKMGMYPNWDIDITLVPADYAAHAIAHISGQEHCWNKAYHLFNQHPIAWHDLMEILKNLGYPMQEVTPEHWSQELRHHATADNPDLESKRFFAALMVAFTGMHYLFHQRPPFDGRNVEAGLAGSDIHCPPVDEPLISRYVAYWQKSGFLPSV